jgi:hypothetical protein
LADGAEVHTIASNDLAKHEWKRLDGNFEADAKYSAKASDIIGVQPLVTRNGGPCIIWRVHLRSYHDPRRRVIAALKLGVTVLLVMIALAGSCFAEKVSSPLKMQQVEKYRQIAHRIIGRIVALKDRYPHLASIDNTAHKEEARDKLWIATAVRSLNFEFRLSCIEI